MDQDELMVNGRGRVALGSRSEYPKIGGKISSEQSVRAFRIRRWIGNVPSNDVLKLEMQDCARQRVIPENETCGRLEKALG